MLAIFCLNLLPFPGQRHSLADVGTEQRWIVFFPVWLVVAILL
jgi:hypothetical protein